MRFLLALIVCTILPFGGFAAKIENQTDYVENNYIEKVADYLEISPNATIFISETSPALIRLSDEVELLGLAQQLGKDRYIIFIDPNLSKKKFRLVLAHEMVHIKQFQDGDLVHLSSGVEYKGQIYYNDDSYYSRPYELDAMRNEWRIYKMFKDVE